jgi:hypothetical protein
MSATRLPVFCKLKIYMAYITEISGKVVNIKNYLRDKNVRGAFQIVATVSVGEDTGPRLEYKKLFTR